MDHARRTALVSPRKAPAAGSDHKGRHEKRDFSPCSGFYSWADHKAISYEQIIHLSCDAAKREFQRYELKKDLMPPAATLQQAGGMFESSYLRRCPSQEQQTMLCGQHLLPSSCLSAWPLVGLCFTTSSSPSGLCIAYTLPKPQRQNHLSKY